MKKGWFTHTDLTAEQAAELVARYAANHVKTEKAFHLTIRPGLSVPDYLSQKPPRVQIKLTQWRHWE